VAFRDIGGAYLTVVGGAAALQPRGSRRWKTSTWTIYTESVAFRHQEFWATHGRYGCAGGSLYTNVQDAAARVRDPRFDRRGRLIFI
jgi:hypothetical protein